MKMQCRLRNFPVPLLAFTILLSGCYHKDWMTDRSDNVVGNLIYEGPEGTFIISKEEIFQADSKSSGGGINEITGSTEYRLSSYDIRTGELSGRASLGDQIEEANALVGFSNGKVWMFSINPEIGLHYRDPKTLEIKEAWPELSKKPGLGSFKPARPDWPLIYQYFAHDCAQNKLILSDEAGFRHALDPETFALQKVETAMPKVEWEPRILNSSGELAEDDRIYLEGDTRKTITTFEKKSSADLSFLFGEWILDTDPYKAAKRDLEKKENWLARNKKLEDSLRAYEAVHPEATQEMDYMKWSYDQRRIHDLAEGMRRNLEYAKRDYESALRSDNHALNYPLLTTDGKSAYIRHANLIADTAHVMISRVNLQPDSTWSLAWSTLLPHLYHDYSKADQAGAFETVYSSGNPRFDYQWAGQRDDFIVLIAQLQMFCIDAQTGKLLWEKEI